MPMNYMPFLPERETASTVLGGESMLNWIGLF